MKHAGRKNSGAWFRTNKFLKKLNSTNQAAVGGLKIAISNIETFPAYIAALQDIVQKTGISGVPEFSQLTQEFLSGQYATVGIPQCVYLGYLSFDTYIGGKGQPFVPEHAKQARLFGEDLRQCLKQFIFGYRQAEDVLNLKTAKQGNPGGIADATKGD